MRRSWEALFAPIWAAPWAVYRLAFVVAGLLTHGPRVLSIGDAYASPDLHLATHPLGTIVDSDPAIALATWALGMLGLGALAYGGRLARPALILFLVAFWGFVSSEGANVKAYDRLILLEGVVLGVGPVSTRDAACAARSPLGRQLLLLVFMGLYASTGLSKLVNSTDGWLSGRNLAFALIDPSYGGRELGIWLSGISPLMRALSIGTIAFEVLFAPLVLLRRTNPFILLAGVGFHIGTALTMHVGTFPWVALSAYPAMLHPDAARGIYDRIRSRGRWSG